MGGGKTATYHWMFNDAQSGRRVLDYWPGNGKWRQPDTGATGVVDHPAIAVALATKAAGRD